MTVLGRAMLATAMAASLSVGCSDSPTAAKRRTPATLDIVSGDGQTGQVGMELPSPLVVKVSDTEGRPVVGQLVNFRIVSGGGSVFAGSALTNTAGVAQERWTLGTSTQGTQKVEARAVDGTTGVALVLGSFTASAIPGAVAALEIISGNGQSVLAGTPLPVRPAVRAKDQYGNAVPGVSVTFAVSAGGGSVAGAMQSTDANGVATGGSWTLGLDGGAQALAITAQNGVAATITAVARSRTPAQVAILEGDGQTAAVGTAVSTAPSVVVRNAFGDAIPGVSVSFTVVTGGGSLGGASTETDADGRASLGRWTLGTAAGAQSLRVMAGALSIEFKATAAPGLVARLVFIAPPVTEAEVGSQASVAVRAMDEFGNPVSGASVAFDVTAGGGSIAPSVATAGPDGGATAEWTIGSVAGQNSARARAGNTAISLNVAGRPGAAVRLVKMFGDNQAAVVGSSPGILPAVLVVDRFDNPVPGAVITFSIGTGGGTTGGTATSGLDGTATARAWVLGTAVGPNTLVASTAGAASATFTASARPGAPAALTKIAGDAQAAAVGATLAIRPTVVVRDSYGNPVPGVAVSFDVLSGGGSISGANSSSDADGTAAVGSWTLASSPGFQELRATVQGIPTVVFTATASSRTASRMIPHPSNLTTARYGDRIPAGVIVTDDFGDPVAGVPVTFSIPAGTGGSSVTGANAVTDANGVARVGTWSVYSCAGSATLSAAAAGIAAPLDLQVAVSTDVAVGLTIGNDPVFQASPSVDGVILGKPNVTLIKACSTQPLTGVPVTFTVTSGVSFVGGLSSSGKVTSLVDLTDIHGVARAWGWHAGTVPGPTSLEVSAAGPGGQRLTSTFALTIVHGNPARIVKLAGDQQVGPASSALPIAPSVRVEDQYGNPVTHVLSNGFPTVRLSVQFTGLAPGNGVTTFTADSSGVVTASPWVLDSVVGFRSLTVTVPQWPSVTAVFTAAATVPPTP